MSLKADPIRLGISLVSLTGPWKFHTGDDLSWAGPHVNDSNWESVDLTALPGAHDGDVGLSGYVPGWTVRGHAGYAGYAWYRCHLAIAGTIPSPIAILGPVDVDDAYELYINGILMGGDGDFTGRHPIVYSVQPRMFLLPPDALSPSAGGDLVIAIRVWMAQASLVESEEAGGIHIVPDLGLVSTVQDHYHVQWLQTFVGYVADAIEPIVFLSLLLMVWRLKPFDQSDAAYSWMCVALLFTALVRANQVVFYWTQWESQAIYSLARKVFLVPLVLGAWTVAWYFWYRLPQARWVPAAVIALSLLLMILQVLDWPMPSEAVRYLFMGIQAWIVYEGIRYRGKEGWMTAPAVALIATGLFASELSIGGVRGIWFPFGVGVSRTQYAYAVFDVYFFVLIWRRQHLYAIGRPISH